MMMRAVKEDGLVADANVSPDREKTGKRLYLFAWIIEIFAVGIGFGIAAMQLSTSFLELSSGKSDGLSFGDYTNILIAAVPFIMVSVVELTKIPFVDAFYKTSHRVWKVVFLISLIIISGITFESALNGFERNFNALNIGVSRLQRELLVVEESMIPIQDRIIRAEELTLEKIESDYSSRYNELSAQRAEQSGIVEDRKATLRASIQSEYTEGLLRQIEAARAEVSDLRNSQREELASHAARFNNESENISLNQQTTLRALTAEFNREQERLDQIRQQGSQDIKSASIFSRSSVQTRVEQQIADQIKRVELQRARLDDARKAADDSTRSTQYREEQEKIRADFEQRIAAVQGQISSLTAQYNQSIGTRERDVAKTLESYDAEILAIENKFSGQFAEIKGIRDQQLNMLANNTELISKWQSELDALKDDRVVIRDNINSKVAENQIYRMAQLFSGAESAADIPKSYVVNVAVIWFSSLAAMVAFTGVILAMASNVIRDPRLPDHKRLDQREPLREIISKTFRSARRWIAHRRRLDRKPIIKERVREVIKEVPVERVVRHEVPIEILKKEIVHVPLYTNDPKLLKIGVEAKNVDNLSDDDAP